MIIISLYHTYLLHNGLQLLTWEEYLKSLEISYYRLSSGILFGLAFLLHKESRNPDYLLLYSILQILYSPLLLILLIIENYKLLGYASIISIAQAIIIIVHLLNERRKMLAPQSESMEILDT